jgi:hypothetical protein
LEEYRSLRIEIIDAIEDQRKIIQLGVTALSVLIGLALQRISPLLTVTLLVLLVPTVSILSQRERLANSFAQRERVRSSLTGNPLSTAPLADPSQHWEWEEWLRCGSMFVLRDRAEFLAVFSLTAGALSLGFYTLFTTPTLHAAQSPSLVMTLVIISMSLWMACGILHSLWFEKRFVNFLTQAHPSKAVTVSKRRTALAPLSSAPRVSACGGPLPTAQHPIWHRGPRQRLNRGSARQSADLR